MWKMLGFLFLFHLTLFALAFAQNDADFKHELPPGVELVNPKDFGLTDDQLGGLLSNVKVLGGSQIGDTKTQILTVGFEGDENLNFDDFEIPGLTDAKSKDMPDKEKQIANVAFEKFKEFFKDPKKNGNKYEEPRQSQPEGPSVFHRNVVQQQQQQQYHHQSARPTPEILQQHYPVTLTQPNAGNRAPPPQPPPVQIHIQHPQHQQQQVRTPQQQGPVRQHQQPPPRPPPQQHYQQQYQQHTQARPQQQHQPHYQSQSTSNPPSLRQSSHAIAFANNNQPSTSSHGNFGARLTPPTQTSTHPQQQYHNNQQQLQQQPYNFKQYNGPYQNKVASAHVKFPETGSSTPPGNFQRFTLYSTQRPNGSPPTTPAPVGKIVRNQLLFTQPPYTTEQNYVGGGSGALAAAASAARPPPTQEPQEYRTIDQSNYPLPPVLPSIQNPSPSSSSTVSVQAGGTAAQPSSSLLQRFPADDPEKRPFSHVFIQHQNHPTPVQQTSFHPRFQPPSPTRYVQNFTPTVNRLTTTPAPRFEVTPSMPMILLSTNENAITDPKRTELLRRQQRQMQEKKLLQEEKQRQAASLNVAPQHTEPSVYQNHITNEDNRNNNNYFRQQSYESQSVRNQQQSQNSFEFQTQQQQHQLHTLQRQQQSLFFGNQPKAVKQQQQQQQQQGTLPPRPYYPTLSQQSSNNFVIHAVQDYPPAPGGIVPPLPIRFTTRLEPPPPLSPHQYTGFGGRQKRGYRNRLNNIIREILGKEERD